MASITIRNLEDGLKTRLRVRAAGHGRSMEEEVRQILREALHPDAAPALSLGEAIRRRIGPTGGVDLPDLPREALREPPKLTR